MIADDILDEAERTLLDSPHIDHWQKGRERIEAEELLAHALGADFDLEDDVPSPVARRFRGLIERRATGEPVPYIRGWAEFRGMRVGVRRGVFVPRESSEFLAEQAIRRLRRRSPAVAVDLATGSGPVALAVAREVRGAEVYGVDLFEEAVLVARRNARQLGVSVRFLAGDLFSPLPARVRGRVDVVTLHPPYVGKKELRELPTEVLGFEPVDSLTDHSPRGLGLVERTLAEAPAWIRSGGWLLVEVSPDRSRAVATLMRHAGLREVRSTKGGVAVTRVVAGKV